MKDNKKLYVQNKKDGRMSGKRPRFDTPEEFAEAFESYCEHCDTTKNKPCASGMAFHMGFASRQSLWDYRQMEGFEHVANRACLFVERGYEQQLANGRGDSGVIFALKNFGWSDKQEHDHTSSDGSLARPTTVQLVGPDDEG